MNKEIVRLLDIPWQIFRSLRPRQWLKNLSLAAPILFSGQMFDEKPGNAVLAAFVIFCLASSCAYLINDVVDAPKDRSHPYKRLRPIASGKLSRPLAVICALVLMSGALYFANLYLNRFFLITLVLFLLLQFSYTLVIRNLIIMDSLTVAMAFILRVFAGSFATETSISSWLILATIGISLLLAFGKRRSERTLLALEPARVQATHPVTRETLTHYPDTLLDSMISMSASFAIISYSLFSFQISPKSQPRVLLGVLPPTLSAPKWMMLTIPFVIYGVARYLYVIYEKKGGESPERVLLSDIPLLSAVIMWALTTISVIYFIGS